MPDAYEVNGVTITPQSGGYYDLSHPSLGDQTQRVQGKETAENKASEIARDATPPEGSMPPQPDLSAVAPPTPPAPASDDPRDKLIDEMRAHMDRQAKLIEEMGAARSVQTQGDGDEEVVGRVPNGVPRKFKGEMDKDIRARLKKAGFGTTTIVLEEDESIPPTGLFVGHNGNGYVIMPGEKVEVPDFIIGILEDAVTSAPIVDGTSGKVLGYRDRSKYPFRRV